jgi:4-carboxymuconolactone decarboxylase
MSRLKRLPKSVMTGEQLALYDEIVSGRRAASFPGKLLDDEAMLTGPFDVMLRNPSFGIHLSRLGECLRFESSLSSVQIELLILLVSAEWECDYEWYFHAPIAEKVGLDRTLIEEIRLSKKISSGSPALLALYNLFNEIRENKLVSDQTYLNCQNFFTEEELIQATTLIGYYTLLAMWLNTFQIKPDPSLDFFGHQ